MILFDCFESLKVTTKLKIVVRYKINKRSGELAAITAVGKPVKKPRRLPGFVQAVRRRQGFLDDG